MQVIQFYSLFIICETFLLKAADILNQEITLPDLFEVVDSLKRKNLVTLKETETRDEMVIINFFKVLKNLMYYHPDHYYLRKQEQGLCLIYTYIFLNFEFNKHTVITICLLW